MTKTEFENMYRVFCANYNKKYDDQIIMDKGVVFYQNCKSYPKQQIEECFNRLMDKYDYMPNLKQFRQELKGVTMVQVEKIVPMPVRTPESKAIVKEILLLGKNRPEGWQGKLKELQVQLVKD